jgi:anaphase-promoting complex subunit 6
MEKYLREWRQEALNRHQYDSAIFVADKLLALTSMSPSAAPCPHADGPP